MQIDDTIMQKTFCKVTLADKKYFLSIQSEVMDGRIFLSEKLMNQRKKLKNKKKPKQLYCKKCNHNKRSK